MLVKDVMTTAVVTLSPDNSVRHAAKLMSDQRVSGLPVVDNEGHLAGVISEGDLIRRTELSSGAFAPNANMVLVCSLLARVATARMERLHRG